MTISLASLLVAVSKATIYSAGLAIASAIGLPVSSWQEGDPTRSLFHLEAETLSAREELAVSFISSGFLDYATGDWLKILAEQVYGVVVPEATFATTDLVLTNPTGGVFEDIEAGDYTFKNTATGKTYHNITGGTLPAKVGVVNGTLTVTVEADEAGSDSSASAGEIDDIVAGPLDVTCSNAVAAIGVDEQSEATTRAQCRAKLAALSPNGPRGAYTYVALNSELTGTTNITDARSYGDSDTGDVTVYLRGPSGAVTEADRALAETAILENATPLCITPTVLSVANVVVPITYELWIYKRSNKTATEIEEDIEEALEQMFAERPIGGDIIAPATTGKMYRSLIESTIKNVFVDAFRVSVSAPSGDTSLTNGEVAALGTITATINIVTDPT